MIEIAVVLLEGEGIGDGEGIGWDPPPHENVNAIIVNPAPASALRRQHPGNASTPVNARHKATTALPISNCATVAGAMYESIAATSPFRFSAFGEIEHEPFCTLHERATCP